MSGHCCCLEDLCELCSVRLSIVLCKIVPYTESTLISVYTLLRPMLSTDLNPIEQVWDHIESKIRAQRSSITKGHTEEWNKLPVKFLHMLVRSMCQQCTAVIRVNEDQVHH